MKKLLTICILCSSITLGAMPFASAMQGDKNYNSSNNLKVNPAFQDKENMVMIHGGLGVRGSGIESYRNRNGSDGRKFNLGYAMISYSQPTEFFRIAARRSLELGAFIGREKGIVKNTNNGTYTAKDFSQYDQGILGASEEVIVGSKNLYGTLGLGIYIKEKNDNRISSKLTLGERIGVGTNIGNANLEIFGRHFSNGSLTNKDSGYNFVGAALGYKF